MFIKDLDLGPLCGPSQLSRPQGLIRPPDWEFAEFLESRLHTPLGGKFIVLFRTPSIRLGPCLLLSRRLYETILAPEVGSWLFFAPLATVRRADCSATTLDNILGSTCTIGDKTFTFSA